MKNLFLKFFAKMVVDLNIFPNNFSCIYSVNQKDTCGAKLAKKWWLVWKEELKLYKNCVFFIIFLYMFFSGEWVVYQIEKDPKDYFLHSFDKNRWAVFCKENWLLRGLAAFFNLFNIICYRAYMLTQNKFLVWIWSK